MQPNEKPTAYGALARFDVKGPLTHYGTSQIVRRPWWKHWIIQVMAFVVGMLLLTSVLRYLTPKKGLSDWVAVPVVLLGMLTLLVVSAPKVKK